MADSGSKTAANITAFAALLTAIVGAIALFLTNQRPDPPTPTSGPTSSIERTLDQWVSEVNTVCKKHSQKVADAQAEAATWGPIPDVINPMTAAWHSYLTGILDVPIPDGDATETAQAIRRDITAARVSLGEYMLAYDYSWKRLESGEMSTEEASAQQMPHYTAFQEAAISGLSELTVLGAGDCGA